MNEKTQKRIAFGYNRNHNSKIEINETQALAVKLIYEFYADGESMGGISGRLEVCNIPSPYNNPKWGRQAIANILSYERYIGDRVLVRKFYKISQNLKKCKPIPLPLVFRQHKKAC